MAASFVKSPVGSWGPLRRPIAALLRIRPPLWAIRMFLTGSNARELTEQTSTAIRSVQRRVVASRVEQVFSVDATRELQECPVPILYLAGKRDRLVGARVTRRLRSARPELRVVTLDAPHLVLQSRPEEAAAAVVEFVESLAR